MTPTTKTTATLEEIISIARDLEIITVTHNFEIKTHKPILYINPANTFITQNLEISQHYDIQTTPYVPGDKAFVIPYKTLHNYLY